ncbi:MAG TPA: glutamine--tRNA ligase, partial [Anaeromyxobacteraceae bacterium]
DSRPGAPVFNRTIPLKDTWATRAAARPEARKARAKKEPAPEAGPTRKRTTREEARAELRASTPELAARFERYQSELRLGADEADLLTSDLGVARYFDDALAAHGQPRSIARWLANDLLGLAGDARLDTLPLPGAAFGRFVGLVDAGRITPAAGKTLLASLVERGGDPEARVAELGLGKVDDRAAIASAVAQVLEAHAAEVARYRAGEKKLFGVLLGAAMRRTQGAADAAVVRQLLQERLG